MAGNAIHIPSIDAKDIWLTSQLTAPPASGFSLNTKAGDINKLKFRNTLDYSLDLMKLREVYRKICRRKDFSFHDGGKEYSKHVINVTFKYSAKLYNRQYNSTYVKLGYSMEDIELQDNICIRNGELIAIRTGQPVECPLSPEHLKDSFFTFTDGQYHAKSSIPTVYNVAQLRTELYRNGFVCDGIHYVRYKRSAGSSRVGKCLFINAALYDRMHKWEMCGLKIAPGDPVDLAALESYIALTLSSIIGTLKINPENILVIEDHESVFQDQVVMTTHEEGQELLSQVGTATVKNSIWDGQSLICREAMGPYRDHGFVLLRNRFFKSACFNTNMQEWFHDRGITQVSQLNGFTLATEIKQIKLITTPSSIKYMKFGPLKQWLQKLEPMFGVVKTEKKTGFFNGRMVQTHYQLLNSLQLSLEEVRAFLSPSLSYLSHIKTDPAVLRFHIKYDATDRDMPCQTRNDLFYRFLGHNDKFAQTKLYYDFRKDTIKAFLKSLKHGHVLVSGNYSTLFGNGLEMLMEAVGQFDGRTRIGVGNVQSTRFAYGDVLLASRSPHVSMGNILLVTNADIPDIRKYFNLTDEIVCINSIGENVLSRLSGADFDSDTMLLTDESILVAAAKRNYDIFQVATSFVPAQKLERRYTAQEQTDLDIRTSVNKIGEIVNLAQQLNSLIWQLINSGVPAYSPEITDLCNDVCTLNVLSNIEIDKAKREYPIDSGAEINRIRQKHLVLDGDSRKIKPEFFGVIAKDKGYYDDRKNSYQSYLTTMDHVQTVISQYRLPRPRRKTLLSFSEVLAFHDFNPRMVKYTQVSRIFESVRQYRCEQKKIMTAFDLNYAEKCQQVNTIFESTCEYISSFHLSRHTMFYLVRELGCERNRDISRSMFVLLFSTVHNFSAFVQESKHKIGTMVEDPQGPVRIYDFSYRID